MKLSKKANLIKRQDYNRVLITETLPFETPIIFSNDGLYDQISTIGSSCEIQQLLIKTLLLGQGTSKSVQPTSPYVYKVRKNEREYRRLALLHPLSQWRLKEFYQKYERLILHYCDVSPASIRAPRKIAGSFFSKSSWENINTYKNGALSMAASDKYVKHTPSFFSYAGHDRLYKFFNSKDYFSLEKQFNMLATLDVSKCFDSIYTHSLSWAIKDKLFAKKFAAVSSTFGQEFDDVIRHGNFGETNGIPIGPEASRIFAEIIFQEIDRRVIHRLIPLEFGVEYTLRRYVDDVFIFARSEDVADDVYRVYSDVLISFNLHANTSKSSKTLRPFVTPKSRLVYEGGVQNYLFFDKFLKDCGAGRLEPLRIFSRWHLIKSYIESVKALCSHNNSGYDEIASFLISVITERIKKLVNNDLSKASDDVQSDYLTAFEVLMEVSFFLYSVAPSVSASYKLSTSLILVFRFSKIHLHNSVKSVSDHLYGLIAALLFDQCGKPHADGVDGFVNLEYLNIMLAMRELGEFYLLPGRVLFELFIKEKPLSYFTIISCLFYIRDDMQYKALKRTLIKAASSRLGRLSDVLVNSENAYLLLDLLTCPFVPQKLKIGWISSLHSVAGAQPPTTANLAAYLAESAGGRSFVDWADVDLLNSLEKKELKQAY